MMEGIGSYKNGGSCSELCGWLFLLLIACAVDEVADRLVLKVQHGEVKFECPVVAVKIGLFEQFSTKNGQDLDYIEVRTSADHTFKALGTDCVVHCCHFQSFFESSMFRICHVSSPGAVDVLSCLHFLNIHAFYQLSALTFQLTEKRDVRLLVVLLQSSILSYLLMKQAADQFAINDVNLDRLIITKLMTACGKPSFLTYSCDFRCSKITLPKNSISLSRSNCAEDHILLLLRNASAIRTFTSSICSFLSSQQPSGRCLQRSAFMIIDLIMIQRLLALLITLYHGKSQ